MLNLQQNQLDGIMNVHFIHYSLRNGKYGGFLADFGVANALYNMQIDGK